MEQRERDTGVTKERVIEQIAKIAFSPNAKDGDRLRALDWLSEFLRNKNETDEVLARLDVILRQVRGDADGTQK